MKIEKSLSALDTSLINDLRTLTLKDITLIAPADKNGISVNLGNDSRTFTLVGDSSVSITGGDWEPSSTVDLGNGLCVGTAIIEGNPSITGGSGYSKSVAVTAYM